MEMAEILEKRGIDAVLVTDPYNFHYLSGFAGEGILVLCREGKYLVTDSRYTVAAKETSAKRGFTICEFGRKKPLMKWVRELTLEKGYKKVGIEDGHMTVRELSNYRRFFPDITFYTMGDELENLRMVKTTEEIQAMEYAELIGDLAFREILYKIRPGMSELELAAEIEYAMKKNGAEGFSFDTIVASGLNSAKPHHRPNGKKLEKGDFITMDYGCIFHGYCSDMTRTVVLGKANEKQKEVYNTVLKAQLTGLATIKPGLTGAQCDAAARKVIDDAGYGQYFGHALGHSVGLYIHESPALSPTDKRVLKPDMIETCEPGIYIEGFGGVRIEDMCLVTENGCRPLAISPKQLIEIPA